MKTAIGILSIIVLLVGLPACKAEAEDAKEGIKTLMVVASQKFRDEEYTDTRAYLEKNGFSITVASTSLDESTGMLKKAKVKPDMLLKDVITAD
jgi:hypothetical protein